jgi:hypothetical protein
MRFLTLLAVLVCSAAVGQDVIYATKSCANGQCRMVSNTSTAQGVAEACARSGRLQHLGGNGGLMEGIGMASTPEAAIRSCCYYGRIRIVDKGVARGRNGMFFACIRGR